MVSESVSLVSVVIKCNTIDQADKALQGSKEKKFDKYSF